MLSLASEGMRILRSVVWSYPQLAQGAYSSGRIEEQKASFGYTEAGLDYGEDPSGNFEVLGKRADILQDER